MLFLNIGLLVSLQLVASAAADTLLEKYFCGVYYPNVSSALLPPCTVVRDATVSDLKDFRSDALPTLSLGDAHKPALFFIHGWPDSAAEFAAQFGGLCYGPSARYRCVAATWQNFHPDLPNCEPPNCELGFQGTIDRLATTMKAARLVDTTLVIHDWGSWIGYQLMWQHPELMNRTISFDIGQGGHPNTTYQGQNSLAWQTQDSAPSETSARWWRAPCVSCATWRSAWPYDYNVSMRGLAPNKDKPPATVPLLFFWGNMTRGKPRQADSEFFDAAWLAFVASTPHGKVVSGKGDHWLFHENPKLVNSAMIAWLSSLGV